MPSRLIRRLGWTLGAGLFVILAVMTVVPFIASTQIVRDRIALELSMWSGYQVMLGEAPEIEIWPLRANLANVTFREWGEDAQPVMQAEAIEADLSAIAALGGDVVFTALKIQRPTLHLWQSAGRARSTPGWGGGRIGRSIAAARAAIQANPTAPDASILPSDPLGSLEFSDGRVFLHRGGRDSEIFSSVAGRLNWPAFNRSASGSITGIWRGELVTLDISTDSPLFLVAGGTTAISMSLRSAPLNGNFEGRANFSGENYFDGSARLSAPSLGRILEWSRADIVPGASVGAVSLESQVTGSLSRLKLANTALTLESNRGSGTLEMALWEPVPSISGTLAFETMDLRSFLTAFSTLTPDALGHYRTMDDKVSDQIALDLRLSATRATAGAIDFTELAATAQVRPGLAAFDISDASAFGGNVQAGMRIDRHRDAAEVELKLRGENIDMGALAKTLQAHRLMPISRGTFSMTLKGTGEDLADVLRSANGSISGNFGQGAVAGIDIAKFADRAAQGDFFALSETGEGSLAFSGIALKASVEAGNAKVERLDVTTADGGLSLRGIVPLPGRGLALAGTLARAGAEPIPFFVGGSWESPYITPMLPGFEAP